MINNIHSIPLHLHSHYSLRDGCIKIPELISFCVEHSIPACALTDHGTLAGTIEFYKECKKNGIKSLLGIESYITISPDNSEERQKDNGHLVLIAKDFEGYSALCQLSSESFLQNYYYKPRIYLPKLEQFKGHLIGLTACLGGVIRNLGEPIWNSEEKTWTDGPFTDCLIEVLMDCFSPGDLFIELQDWNDGTGIQPAWNDFLRSKAEQYRLPLVLTCDSHYLLPEDHEMHEILMALQLGKTLEEYRSGTAMRYPPFFWVRSPEEMKNSAEKLGVLKEITTSNQYIFDNCNVEIDLSRFYSPVF